MIVNLILMKLDLYQVDAFANKIFEGNPAAVVPLDKWLPKKIMQSIAQENNLSETAFFSKYAILEDSVTGSKYTKLIPYWFERTGKTEFYSKQVSQIGEELFCKYDLERVFLSGYARRYLKGELYIV